MTAGKLVACVPFCAALLLAGEAGAQPVTGQFALDRFEPTPIGDSFFAVDGAQVHGHIESRTGITFDYAHDPLVLRGASPSLGPVVGDQLFAHFGYSFALWDRLLLSFNLPVAFVDTGDSPMLPTPPTTFTSPTVPAVGDTRFGARVNLYSAASGAIDLGVSGYLWASTGKQHLYTSDGTVRGTPEISASGRVSRFVWAADLGAMFRKSVTFDGAALGDEVTFGAAGGVVLGHELVQVGPEIFGSASVASGASAGGATDVELLASARFRIGFMTFGGGIGGGLAKGVGAPAPRVLLSVAYSPEDADGDGIPDAEDACPHEKGDPSPDPTKNGCPDRDHDGIFDSKDACPTVPGVPNADPKKNGCPPDRDGDGIPDADDACPDVPGIPSDDPTRNGCPDRDHDGIPDAQDACPDVPGPWSPDPKLNGCPPDRDGDGIPDAEDACPDIPGVKSSDPKINGCPGDRDGDGIRDDRDACPDVKGVPDVDPRKNGCPKAVFVPKKKPR